MQVCLAPFANPERVLIDAPRIAISPSLATTLAMALNELATNSLKYGALAAPDGRIACVARVEGANLVLKWHESNAGLTITPDSTGSGIRFLRAAFTAGTTIDFGQDGFAFEGAIAMGADSPPT
jgi:two-component sensor histidine kinase